MSAFHMEETEGQDLSRQLRRPQWGHVPSGVLPADVVIVGMGKNVTRDSICQLKVPCFASKLIYVSDAFRVAVTRGRLPSPRLSLSPSRARLRS